MCVNCEVLKGMLPWRNRYPIKLGTHCAGAEERHYKQTKQHKQLNSNTYKHKQMICKTNKQTKPINRHTTNQLIRHRDARRRRRDRGHEWRHGPGRAPPGAEWRGRPFMYVYIYIYIYI